MWFIERFEEIAMTIVFALLTLAAIVVLIAGIMVSPLWLDIVWGSMVLGMIAFGYSAIKGIWEPRKTMTLIMGKFPMSCTRKSAKHIEKSESRS